MSRPKGSIIGARPTWTTTATSGIWTLRQAEEMKADGKWPRGPVAPTSLAGTPGDGQVALTWTAPATTHGTITDYEVQYSADGGATWTTHVPPPPAAVSLSQIDTGGFTWSGAGTLADPYVTTYLRSGVPSIRGNTPGNWSSSNRPAWQVSGSGVFNYTVTGMDSADQNADHGFYISSDSGITWTLAATLAFSGTSAGGVSFAVSDGDIVEQRGGGASYTSDTWVENPTVWLAAL